MNLYENLPNNPDWRELRDDEFVCQYDYLYQEGKEPQIVSSDMGLLHLIKKRYPHMELRYFRCTLGTIGNPYRAEHFINGIVPPLK